MTSSPPALRVPELPQFGDAAADKATCRKWRSAPGAILFPVIGLLIAACLIVDIIFAIRNALNPFTGFEGIGEAPHFQFWRFMGFVIPLAVLALVLVVGVVVVFRYRTFGKEAPGFVWRLTGWVTACIVLVFTVISIVDIAVTNLVEVKRTAADGGGASGIQLAWALIAVALGLVVVITALRVTRSDLFAIGFSRKVISVTIVVAASAISYASVHQGQQNGSQFAAGSYLTSGFHSYTYEPDPQMAVPYSADCGDRSHCAVVGGLSGTNQDLVTGVATTADAGHRWHGVELPESVVGVPASLNCTGAQCWGIFPGYRQDFIASVAIGNNGVPHISLHAFNPPPGTDAISLGLMGACTSAAHCTGFASMIPPRHTPPLTPSLIAYATNDAGASWTSQSIQPPPSTTFDLPHTAAHGGPWCDPEGLCTYIFGLGAPACSQSDFCAQRMAELQSTDGGYNWTMSLVSPLDSPGIGTFNASCQAMPVCTITWDQTDRPSIYVVSHDGGATWSSLATLDGTGFVKCGSGATCLNSIEGASWDMLAASFDGGRSWSDPVSVYQGEGLPNPAVMGCSTDGPCLIAEAVDTSSPNQIFPTYRSVVTIAIGPGHWSKQSLPTFVAAKVTTS